MNGTSEEIKKWKDELSKSFLKNLLQFLSTSSRTQVDIESLQFIQNFDFTRTEQMCGIVPGLKISVGHGHLSDPFVKLSDVTRKAPDILSDRSKIESFSSSDPNVLISDKTLTLCDVIFLCKECSYSYCVN